MRIFDGRVIFDHQPKTAGEALRVWLTSELGNLCVSRHCIMPHQQMIREFGGVYSVLCGHFSFSGEKLDPRYDYITIVRDPVDRVISWLFFVLKNHDRSQLPEMYDAVEQFVESEGRIFDPLLTDHISNMYVRHFCSIDSHDMDGFSIDLKSQRAFDVVKTFTVVGLFEEMPEFLADVASVVKIPSPKEIEKINVTKVRPSAKAVSSAFRDRIIELNSLDIQFYEKVREWKHSLPVKSRSVIKKSPWILCDGIDFRESVLPSCVVKMEGISAVESAGRWTDAHLSRSAKITFNKNLFNSFVMRLDVVAFGPNVGRDVTVLVGTSEQCFIVPEPGKVHHVELEFSNAKGANTIEIIPPNPTSPCTLDPASKDTRKLGVQLVTMKIIEKQA